MLPILYQDRDLIAIHKPAGLLVHRSGLDAGETRFALQLLREQIGQHLWPVHRLDKGTSGLLLFALHADAARTLAQAFETGQVRKEYRAMVRGWPAGAGTLDYALSRLKDERPGPSQPARTHWQTLAHYTLAVPQPPFAQTRCALLALQPETGRRHQLRRHCKHLAHPIIGDATHGKGPLNRALATHLGTQRLWLHAFALQLPHPRNGQPLQLQADLGPEWALWASLDQARKLLIL